MGGEEPLKSESIEEINRLSLPVRSVDVCVPDVGSVVFVIEDSSDDRMASKPVEPRRSVG